jgi:hypothetical protein
MGRVSVWRYGGAIVEYPIVFMFYMVVVSQPTCMESY